MSHGFSVPHVDVRRPDLGDAGILRISDLRPRSLALLVVRPRHAARRCRASDVSGRLERRLAGHSRRALPCGCAGALPSTRARRWWPIEQKRLPMTAEIVRSNRRGGPEGVIDAVEQLAPDGFTNIENVLSYRQREAIVRGYAGKAGFAARGCTAGRSSAAELPESAASKDHARLKRLSAMAIQPRSRSAAGGGGRKWMLCSAASSTTSSGFCSFML